jgi:hypothetical protein
MIGRVVTFLTTVGTTILVVSTIGAKSTTY